MQTVYLVTISAHPRPTPTRKTNPNTIGKLLRATVATKHLYNSIRCCNLSFSGLTYKNLAYMSLQMFLKVKQPESISVYELEKSGPNITKLVSIQL